MKTQEELANNPWADAHKYADNKYHMEKGDKHINKYERYEEVKEAFEAGYRQALEDYKDKRYIDEHMLLAYVNGGANLAEDFKDATKMKENFNRLMAAIDKSIDGNTNN
jgi:acetylornithine/succinyldiaminopimelate/putrescine aminotransferase